VRERERERERERSGNWNKIIECLMKYEVPQKLIKLIGLTLINSTAKVKIGNQFTN